MGAKQRWITGKQHIGRNVRQTGRKVDGWVDGLEVGVLGWSQVKMGNITSRKESSSDR